MTKEYLQTDATRPLSSPPAGLCSPAPDGSADNKPSTISLYNDLYDAVRDIVSIVEGVQSVRWECNGKRIKDTPEWCRLYVAQAAVERAREESRDKVFIHAPKKPNKGSSGPAAAGGYADSAVSALSQPASKNHD